MWCHNLPSFTDNRKKKSFVEFCGEEAVKIFDSFLYHCLSILHCRVGIIEGGFWPICKDIHTLETARCQAGFRRGEMNVRELFSSGWANWTGKGRKTGAGDVIIRCLP